MSEETKPETKPKGERKAKATRETELVLFLGFLVAAWMKTPADIFGLFVAGLVGKLSAFMWGNSQEHKAVSEAPK